MCNFTQKKFNVYLRVKKISLLLYVCLKGTKTGASLPAIFLTGMKPDKFVLALIGTVVLAWFIPQFASGIPGSVLRQASTLGIGFIFFFYGLRLSPAKIRMGLGNWRLHLLVQATTFVLFPLIILAFYPFIQQQRHEILWLGLFFLAALPSTVSFSVIMTSMGRGNIPAAIFNASISGIIGVLVTPLWMGLFLQQTEVGFDFSEIYLKLFLQIILPVTVGVLLQSRWHGFTAKYARGLSIFDQLVILLIVYNSFARSFGDSVFASVHLVDLILLVVFVVLLLFLVYGIVFLIAGWINFNREDKITALFCGSTKSLVHGSVFARVLFNDFAFAGMMLVPLMLFHALQIFILSIVAARFGRVEPESAL